MEQSISDASWPANPERRASITKLSKECDSLACRLHRAMLQRMTELFEEAVLLNSLDKWGASDPNIQVSRSVRDWESITLPFDIKDLFYAWVVGEPIIIDNYVLGYTVYGGSPISYEQINIFRNETGGLFCVRNKDFEVLTDALVAIENFTKRKSIVLQAFCKAAYKAKARHKVMTTYLSDVN